MPEVNRETPAQGVLTDAAQAVGGGILTSEGVQGLSWSWDLDFRALLAALNEPAPWNRPDATDGYGSAAGAIGDSATGDSAASAAEADQAELMEAIEAGRTREVPLAVVAGRIAESLPTGPDLAGWLAVGSAGELEDGALAGVAASYRRLASWAQAGELAAVAQMASRSAAADDTIGVDAEGRPARTPDEACAQVSLALTMSQCGASWWTDLGITLTWRLAATGAALRSGAIDLPRARLIAEATALLDDDTVRAVEAKVLPAAGQRTTAQLRAALRRAVIAADPEGADRRRREAERRAKVSLYPDEEGTASLAGYSLPGTRAAAAMARISALARAMRASGADGGIDLLRAQVFLGLLLGTLPCTPPAPDSPPDDPYPDDPRPRDPRNGRDAGAPGSGDRVPDRDADDPGPSDPSPECGCGCDDLCALAISLPSLDDDDVGADPRPAPAWPDVTALLRPAPPAMGGLRPSSGGLLDLTLPWAALAGDPAEPGYLSRIGPITPAQACHLADLAASDTAVQWRIIVTSPTGQALTVARIPRSTRAGPLGAASPPGLDPDDPDSSLIGRVTLTISQDTLTRSPPPAAPAILTQAWQAAARAAARAAQVAAADAIADGGCAHTEASLAYRPTPRLKERITARDVTCRFPTCRQPVWRCDLDHSIPYDQGGRTCACNLGGLCRFHHQLKQHLRWQLTQPAPGHFQWTTPTGRAYATGPDSHL